MKRYKIGDTLWTTDYNARADSFTVTEIKETVLGITYNGVFAEDCYPTKEDATEAAAEKIIDEAKEKFRELYSDEEKVEKKASRLITVGADGKRH